MPSHVPLSDAARSVSKANNPARKLAYTTLWHDAPLFAVLLRKGWRIAAGGTGSRRHVAYMSSSFTSRMSRENAPLCPIIFTWELIP